MQVGFTLFFVYKNNRFTDAPLRINNAIPLKEEQPPTHYRGSQYWRIHTMVALSSLDSKLAQASAVRHRRRSGTERFVP